MDIQKEKPRGLPNPYALGGLPNPYPLRTGNEAPPSKPAGEQEKLEEKKTTAPRFLQPQKINRPQPKGNNTIVKLPVAPKPQAPSKSVEHPPQVSRQPGLEYWMSTEADDQAVNARLEEEKREKNYERKQRKKFMKMYNWNPEKVYRISVATKLDGYDATGAYQDKINGFLDFLQKYRDRQSRSRSNDETSDPRQSSHAHPKSPIAAPNSKLSPSLKEPSPDSKVATPSVGEPSRYRKFAPPSSYEPLSSSTVASPPVGEDERSASPANKAPVPAVPPTRFALTPAILAERIRLAKEKARQMASSISQPPPPPPPEVPSKTPEAVPPPPPPPPPAKPSHVIEAPPVRYSHIIEGAPVHYARPKAEEKDDGAVNERPAKKQKIDKTPKPTKAALMMAKMGYVKGQGLGKNNDGVTTHLEVKIRKDQRGRQVRDDFGDDSKAVKSQQVFDITGGLRAQPTDYGIFGEPSRVVVAWGCVDGVDFRLDADRNDGGIRQEMGDTFNSKFGPVERIHVNLASATVPVYILFKDPLCAMNAVNRFHEGYEFRGKQIRAQFYNEQKFNNFVYDY